MVSPREVYLAIFYVFFVSLILLFNSLLPITVIATDVEYGLRAGRGSIPESAVDP